MRHYDEDDPDVAAARYEMARRREEARQMRCTCGPRSLAPCSVCDGSYDDPDEIPPPCTYPVVQASASAAPATKLEDDGPPF